MHKFKWKTASAVAALSIGLIGAGIITAQAAVHVKTQKAEQALGVLTMPSGDSSSAAAESAGGPVFEGPRLSSIPDAELERLKNLVGAGDGPDSVGEAPALAPAPKAVLVNCTMNVATGAAPSDVHGAATPTNLIEVTNRDIMIRNKATCGLVSSMSLATFFSQNFGFTIAPGESLFDPRVVYDRLAGRCIVIVDSRNSGNTNQFLYVAASTTSSCTAWRRYRFILSRISPAALFCKATAANFYDYPNLGYNNTRAVVTSNNFTSATGSFTQGTLLSMDKGELYSGAPSVHARCFRSSTYPFSMAPAIQQDFNTSMFILSTGAGSGSVIRRFRLTPSGSGAGMTDTFTALSSINIPFWTAPPDAVQPNGRKIDSLDGRLQSASKQIGTVMWQVHAVNVGGFSRWRMYKVSTSGTSVLFSRTPTTGTCANVDHLFNPSIDTNSTSTSALAFVTASRTCPSQAAGRAAHLIFRGANASNVGWVFNTVATSANQFTILGGSAGSASCNTTGTDFRGSCRWGDYSSTQIDPSSPTTAWGFNQLITTGTLGGAQSQFNWTTRAGRVN